MTHHFKLFNAARPVRRGLARCLMLALGFAILMPGQVQAADETLRRASAPTQWSISDLAVGKRDRLEFSDGDFKGWVRRDGEIFIESEVAHSGLFCAEYQVGVRIGAGSPGCANVRWLSEVVYATRRTQCNNSGLRHSGGATDASLTGAFDKITCVERVVRCSGSACK